MNFYKLYINGEWVDGNSGEFIEIENPANKEIIAKVPRGNKVDVDKAVACAKEALKTWQYEDLENRVNLMQKVVDGLKENRELLIETITKELGSPYKVSRDVHVDPFILEAENYIKIAKEFEYEKILSKSIIRREPVGIVGGLTPWNFPLEQIVKKVVPALLAGNCVVLKPSQMTPLTAYILTEMIDKAGYPKGVYNLVCGRGGEVGNALAIHEDIDMISFTGSTEAGRDVARLALNTIKKLALELGGKSATILLKDGDYELGVKATLDTVYLNAGQTCNAYTRLLVPREDLKVVEDIILKQTDDYKFGTPEDKTVDIGPLASKKQFDRVKEYIEIGVKEGARILLGEVPIDCENGYYVKPVVFTDVNNKMKIAQEEVFGPVLVVIPYDKEEKAIEIANDSIYGLAGAVFGPEDRAREVARKMRTGTVYVNEGEWDVDAPFGGYKQSGLGREGGAEGYSEFLEIKSIYVK
ncbi:aldehyde dehydrogenase family protein [Paraclostridium bifermentans]|uniref:aldehyde dehydrogenase family protein n=1 Tax=Paraclostridium bifermentans TaxID=1490 RepID=UPI00359C209D